MSEDLFCLQGNKFSDRQGGIPVTIPQCLNAGGKSISSNQS